MKKRRKPLILLGFPAEFLAFPRWFEHPTYRLGGGRSIQLSYGNIFKIYSILVLNLLNVNRLCPKGGRYNIFLGGERSILLSYGNVLRCYNNTMIAKNQFLNAIWLVLQEWMRFWHSLRSWYGGTQSFLVHTPSASSNSRNSAEVLCRVVSWYFAYGSWQFKKLGSFGTSPNGSFHGTNFGTQSVLVFISVSTFAQAQVERI